VRESDFLSIVSHELRTPITVIVGLAATLANRRDHLTEEQIDECLGQIRHQGERLGVLVADLLDLSQLDAGRFRVTLSSVELSRAVALAVEDAPPPNSSSVDVEVPADLWVVADSARLEQVLINLLTNAYRYGGSVIRLEAHDRSDHVLLTLSDDGEGVPEELVRNLFEKHSRGGNSESHTGFGLGLAIVRGLVEAFGGQVWYEPATPTGARFNVALRPAVGGLLEQALADQMATPAIR
jgi:two-component system, OmpR family, sensor histidine kinase KdpD